MTTHKPPEVTRLSVVSAPARPLANTPAALTALLAYVSREALQGEGLDAVLQRIVDSLVRQLPVAVASIILLNESCTHFIKEVMAGHLDLDTPAPLPWPVSNGAAGRCARNGRAELITDLAGDPDYVPGNRAVQAEYLVPIRHRTRLHGVLNIESTHKDFFDATVCNAFDAVADQVAGAIHLARVVNELEAANRKLERLSMLDGLTGIANRRGFDLHLAHCWSRAETAAAPLGLLLVDADFFKQLNDACGHLYGDECLKELARLCSACLDSPEDLVARYGGEELMLVLPGRDLAATSQVATRLRAKLDRLGMPHPASTVSRQLTVSIGVTAACPDGTITPRQLIAAADTAMYAAKAAGRDRIACREADTG